MSTPPSAALTTDAEAQVFVEESLTMFKPKDRLDRVFEIGIIAKGLNGAAELVGGLLLLFVTPARIHHLAAVLTQGELSEDPHDFIATHLLHTANGLAGSAVLFGAIYLLTHGLVKVCLLYTSPSPRDRS